MKLCRNLFEHWFLCSVWLFSWVSLLSDQLNYLFTGSKDKSSEYTDKQTKSERSAPDEKLKQLLDRYVRIEDDRQQLLSKFYAITEVRKKWNSLATIQQHWTIQQHLWILKVTIKVLKTLLVSGTDISLAWRGTQAFPCMFWKMYVLY